MSTSRVSLASYSSFLRSVFPDATRFEPDYLDWLYLQNPSGTAVGCDAWYGNSLAGHYVTVPIDARIAGRSAHGLLSLNTATHPDHQGKGLFTRLAKATFEHGRQLGFEFVIGVANANSTPGFVRKLGFQLVGPLEARVGVGNPLTVEPETSYDFERVWNKDSLAWRMKNPAESYSLNRRGDLTEISSPTDKRGIRAVLGTFPAAYFGAERSSAPGFRPLRLWLGSYPEARWRRTLSLAVPRRLRPSPLNLIYLNLGEAPATLRPEHTLFRGIDFDAY